MELSYEIKMEVLSVNLQDKLLDFFLKGAIIQIWMIMICKASPWPTPAAILLSSDTRWETWLLWIHLPSKWTELMLPHDEQRQHLSSSAPTVAIFEKTINWVCFVNHFEFKQNKTKWSETARMLRMGFVCLLSAVESEGKGGCLNLRSPGGAYTFTK